MVASILMVEVLMAKSSMEYCNLVGAIFSHNFISLL
jgi:hypothetical protein